MKNYKVTIRYYGVFNTTVTVRYYKWKWLAYLNAFSIDYCPLSVFATVEKIK